MIFHHPKIVFMRTTIPLHQRIVATALLCWAWTAAAQTKPVQEMPSNKYISVIGVDSKKGESRMATAAVKGYRVVNVSQMSKAVLMERMQESQPACEYKVFREEIFFDPAKFRRRLNALAATGFRVIRGSAGLTSETTTNAILGFGGSSKKTTLLLEKAPGAQGYEYLLKDVDVNTRSVTHENFEVVDLVIGSTQNHFVLLERPVSNAPPTAEPRWYEAVNYKEEKIQAAAQRGDLLGFTAWDGTAIMFTGQPKDRWEYVKLKPSRKMPEIEASLNELGDKGYRLIASALGAGFIMGRPVLGANPKHLYRLVKLKDEETTTMAGPLADGYLPVALQTWQDVGLIVAGKWNAIVVMEKKL